MRLDVKHFVTEADFVLLSIYWIH